MKKIISIVIFLILSIFCFSQKSGNIWYFGNFAGLDFNTPTPSILTNGMLSTNEGCASIADPISGQLLFFRITHKSCF